MDAVDQVVLGAGAVGTAVVEALARAGLASAAWTAVTIACLDRHASFQA